MKKGPDPGLNGLDLDPFQNENGPKRSGFGSGSEWKRVRIRAQMLWILVSYSKCRIKAKIVPTVGRYLHTYVKINKKMTSDSSLYLLGGGVMELVGILIGHMYFFLMFKVSWFSSLGTVPT